MKSGVVGIVEGDYESIDPGVNEFQQDGLTLKNCIEIIEEVEFGDGKTAQAGRVAKEQSVSKEEMRIQDDSITPVKGPKKETLWTSFLSVPGEYVIIGSSDGAFAYDIIGRNTGTLIEQGTLSLSDFYSIHEEADYWQAGFYGNSDEANTGAIYGNNVFEDSELGGVLELSELNLLGATYPYQDQLVKITMAESGYVNVYNPDFDSDAFLEFFMDELAPVVTNRD